MHLVHTTHATKFRLALFAAIALLAVIGAIVVLPLNAEAGQRLKVTGVDMNITPTADATLDNKKVDITLTWSASRNATGYQIDRRERMGDLSGPIVLIPNGRGGKLTGRNQILQAARPSTILTVSTKWASTLNGEFA